MSKYIEIFVTVTEENLCLSIDFSKVEWMTMMRYIGFQGIKYDDVTRQIWTHVLVHLFRYAKWGSSWNSVAITCPIHTSIHSVPYYRRFCK